MKAGSENTWVIRQNGVYHQYDQESKQSTWMLFFPNRESYFPDKIISSMKAQHPLQPHLEFHFVHFDQWRWYIINLEKQYHELVSYFLGLDPSVAN